MLHQKTFCLIHNSGYADVPWVDNDGIIIADRLKALGEAGITFDQFYASPQCSPSRAAALTGYYPIHNGFNVSQMNFPLLPLMALELCQRRYL